MLPRVSLGGGERLSLGERGRPGFPESGLDFWNGPARQSSSAAAVWPGYVSFIFDFVIWSGGAYFDVCERLLRCVRALAIAGVC